MRTRRRRAIGWLVAGLFTLHAVPFLFAARFRAALSDIERRVGKCAPHICANFAVLTLAGVRDMRVGTYIGLTCVVGCRPVLHFFDELTGLALGPVNECHRNSVRGPVRA